MNEDEASRLLSRAADSVPPIPRPPTNQLIEQGKRVQRRQRVISAGSVAAVAALIIGAGALWLPGSSGSAQPTNNETTIPDDSGLPAAPEGTRWVGFNGVMVAVPEAWTINDTVCGGALSNTVSFDDEADDCPHPGDSGVFMLQAVDSSSPLGREWKEADGHEATDIGGEPATRVITLCEESRPPGCYGALLVPDRHAVFIVTGQDPDVVDAILDTASVVPEGYTAVPDIQQVGPPSLAMKEADLVWDGTPCDDTPGEALCAPPYATDPAAGSVVPVGTTVDYADENVDEPPADELPGEPPTEADLIGTWRLLTESGTDSAPVGWREVSFGTESSYGPFGWGGHLSCNRAGGEVRLGTQGAFNASLGFQTSAGCGSPQPPTGGGVLLTASQVRLDGDRLYFYNDANEPLGTFVRSDAAEDELPGESPTDALNAETVKKGTELLRNGGVHSIDEADHGFQEASLSGTWNDLLVTAVVAPEGVRLAKGRITNVQELGGEQVMTVDVPSSPYPRLRFTYGSLTVDLHVFAKEGEEFLPRESRSLVSAILCPSECGDVPDGADG